MIKYILLLALVLSCACQQAEEQTDQSQNESIVNESSEKFSRDSFNLDLFKYGGAYQLRSSNCSDIEMCKPTIDIKNDTEDASQIIITMTYPESPDCQDKSGQVVEVREKAIFGMFNDTDESSPLFKALGYLRLNSMSLYIVKPVNKTNQQNQDMESEEENVSEEEEFLPNDNENVDQEQSDNVIEPIVQDFCFEDWGNDLSKDLTEADTDINRFKGLWYLDQVLKHNESTICCIPDTPVLVKPNEDDGSLLLAWRYADCDACAPYKGEIIVREHVPALNGSFHLVEDDSVVVQVDEETVITVSHGCAGLWIKQIQVAKCEEVIETLPNGQEVKRVCGILQGGLEQQGNQTRPANQTLPANQTRPANETRPVNETESNSP